eukprot:345691-Prymnesium_polylepis.1
MVAARTRTAAAAARRWGREPRSTRAPAISVCAQAARRQHTPARSIVAGEEQWPWRGNTRTGGGAAGGRGRGTAGRASGRSTRWPGADARSSVHVVNPSSRCRSIRGNSDHMRADSWATAKLSGEPARRGRPRGVPDRGACPLGEGWPPPRAGALMTLAKSGGVKAKRTQATMRLERAMGLKGKVPIEVLLSVRILLLLFVYLTAGVLFYRHTEGWDTLQCLYFAVVTMTTVGYSGAGGGGLVASGDVDECGGGAAA